MSDFFQTSIVPTLHRLGNPDLKRLESEIRHHATERPLALILPCHFHEIGGRALEKILSELQKIDYLKQIVVGIDGAYSEDDWQKARRTFSRLQTQTRLIWNDSPAMLKLFQRIANAKLIPRIQDSFGKGRNIWNCLGYVLSSKSARVVAVHDCDILTYDRELLARLCYPVVNPNFGFDFCKGFSARFTDQLNGRVMRLMLTPLLRSLQSVVGDAPFLKFLDAFRYPLAGEICIDLDLARRIHIAADWGVEIGMLAEIYRVANRQAFCQADLAERYDHKHQALSAENPEKGLHKMATEIAKNLFRNMAAEGIPLDGEIFKSLTAIYHRHAQETLRFYRAEAEINALHYPHEQEELAVATFAHSIQTAGNAFLAKPHGAPLIPDWNSVQAAFPDFLDALFEAVEQDNR